jgi:hypothetical protein
MSETNHKPHGTRKGPLNPSAEDRVVVIGNPPNDTLRMSPEEADVSAVRLMDAADRSRKGGESRGDNDD